MWHCPHCGAPQSETARCWVCRRSSTTCSTCRHFRTSLATDLGYCAKDRRRAPLTGLELRSCWEEGSRASGPRPMPAASQAIPLEPPGARSAATVRGNGGPLDRPNPMRLRGFVPLDELAPPSTPDEPASMPAILADTPPDTWETRTSLFGDAEG